MEICYVLPIFWSVTRMLIFCFYFSLFVSSFVVSTFQLSNRPSNVSDQEALLGFMSAISQEYDASHSLSTAWKPNVSFCQWKGIRCSRRRQRVVSLDVSNMGLQGEDMTQYLIDFGIATICFANSKDSAFTSTHALKGSPGYIPPEYGLGGHVTTKGDVYSYGIVLLEMLSGKKPTHTMFVEGMNLQRWVSSSFPDHIEEVVDGSLLRRTSTIAERDKELHCLNQLLSLGLFSTKESPERRPTMINIVSQLQSIKDTFLGTARVPRSQSDMTHLLGSTSTLHNICVGDQSSSTS